MRRKSGAEYRKAIFFVYLEEKGVEITVVVAVCGVGDGYDSGVYGGTSRKAESG